MALTHWLIDKSAYARLGRAVAVDTWLTRLERGLVRLSNITRLEIGTSFRSGSQARLEISVPPLSLMPVVYLTPAIEERACEIQLRLADKGQRRTPSIPDLLIAATAELTGLTVLHADKDFDLIAEITGQPVERLEWID